MAGRHAAVFIAALFAVIIAGQVVAKKRPTYPFVKWGMYAPWQLAPAGQPAT